MLPNAEDAYISPEKLTDYLLSETHAVGKSKASFFRAHGYNDDNLQLLEQDLLSVPRYNEINGQITSPHGTKYIARGVLETPRGTAVTVNTVWIVERSDERPRFVTAYPV
jgi:hypothetical protein